MNAKAYLIVQSETKPSSFFNNAHQEIVFGQQVSPKELHITAFLGRGDYVNENGIVIANESIPQMESRWFGAHHVMTEGGKHVRYKIPSNLLQMSSLDQMEVFRAQALPHSIGRYVDAFHITDETGIHNMYGTLSTKHPLALQAWKEKKFPNFTSSSLLNHKSDEKGRLLEWTPIDNTSVNDPANGKILAQLVGSCQSGASCVTELKASTFKKLAPQITIKQSSMQHGQTCVKKAFKKFTNHFVSNNIHYSFLSQSSIMSSEGDTGANANNAPVEGAENANANETQTNQQTDNTQTQMLGKDVFTKRDNPQTVEEMTKIDFTEADKNKQVSDVTKIDENQPETIETLKAKLAAAEARATAAETNQAKEFAELKAKVDNRDKTDAVVAKINELAGKMSSEKKSKLVEYYMKDFGSLELKEMMKAIERNFEMVMTPIVKQSSTGTPDEITSDITNNYVAQSSKQETPKRKSFDVEKVGQYL